MPYSGIALGNIFDQGRKSGEITLTVNKICFTYPQGVIEWDIDKVELSYGGAGNSLIFIKNAAQPEVTLSTQDKKILKDPAFQYKMNTSNNVQKLKSHFRVQWIALIITGIVIITPLVLFFAFRNQIVLKIAKQVPITMEQKIGDKLFSAVTAGNTIIKDSALNARFNEVAQPLVNVIPPETFRFKFYIVKDSVVNAYALPGGHVVINSGLILKSDSWNEVMGVVAHEMAHVTQRHHVRGIINKMGLFTIASMFLGDYSAFADLLMQMGGNLESLLYSRKFEYEADNKGWEYIGQASMNPRGMISFFEKLQKEHGEKSSSAVSEILSTHPATAERIENLKQKLAADKPDNITDSADIESFKKRLKQLN